MFNDVVHGMGRLLAYFYELIPNYGIGIIFLTILVRVAMIPLAVKQAHIMEKNRGNAEKMRKLLPEVKKIKEKYKDDKARQYEEQKKLYDHHGVNMLGGLSGCLPMLVQMPVFLAMYQVLSGCNKIFGGGRTCTLGFHLPGGSSLKEAIVDGRASFLGMNLNLHPSEALQDGGLISVLPYYLLIAVMGYTMWYQTRQMMKAQPVVDPQMAQTQKIMQFMPLILVFASLNFPAGLTVYWSATNIWSIAQQFVLMRKFGPATREQEERAPAPSGLLTGLMGRLKGAQSTRGESAPSGTGKGETKSPTTRQAGRAPNRGGARPAKPAAQGPKKSAAKPAQKPAGKTPAKPAAQKSSAQAAKIPTPEPESQKPEDQSTTDSRPEGPAGESSGQAAGKPPAPKTPARAAPKQPSGAGGRRPAANRARTAPAGKPGQPKTGAKSPAGKAESAAGGRPAGTGAAPGRPKGSGARKKRQGR
ncbi:MAG: membrane protein insertase YidC [Actinomycetota bacterium]